MNRMYRRNSRIERIDAKTKLSLAKAAKRKALISLIKWGLILGGLLAAVGQFSGLFRILKSFMGS